ncbi:PREDICTED: glycine-rich cell wall structural protein-like [Camelina sativa]|uniref:Glycine-rich cell wall structural protein-like n=1 Tax=Camelina sativa TaxID=90675 RepID=A0ABM0ZBL6_CAMSA|nr:PREDICTED: glycine-rich cell wall structural protein-like [Camelina sativa]
MPNPMGCTMPYPMHPLSTQSGDYSELFPPPYQMPYTMSYTRHPASGYTGIGCGDGSRTGGDGTGGGGEGDGGGGVGFGGGDGDCVEGEDELEWVMGLRDVGGLIGCVSDGWCGLGIVNGLGIGNRPGVGWEPNRVSEIRTCDCRGDVDGGLRSEPGVPEMSGGVAIE